MEFPERLSERLTRIIAENVDGFSEEKLAEINYGIAVFITNSYKIILMFLMAMVAGVFKHFLLTFLCFGTLRTFAAGIHAKREWTCLPVSIIIYFGMVYASLHLKLNTVLTSIIFLFCFVVMLRYAPADTEERPIVSKKLRALLKRLSCIITTLFYLLTVHNSGTPVSLILTFSTVMECILILPATYRLVRSPYDNGKIINGRESQNHEKSVEAYSVTH